MIFCSLKPQYCLRGWAGMPYALRYKNFLKRLDKKSFDALILCDGQNDLDTFRINEDIQHALSSFEKEGVVVFHKEPRTLDPKQYYQYYDNRFFLDVMWSVTGKCNFRCRHCYLDAPDSSMGELSTEEAFSIIDQMAECGIYRVELTGGEPFVRKDFWELVDRLCDRDITVTQVYTNGWMLTEEVLNRFSERGLHPEFSISFDGIGWHDWMRGVKGAEEAALNALNLCRDKGFSTNVEMCVHKGNIKTVRETIRKLAETETRYVKIGEVMNTELWRRNAEGTEMTRRMYFDAMLDYIPQYFEDGMPVELIIGSMVRFYKGSAEYVPLAEPHDGTEKCLNWHICGATRSSCYIAPDGRLLPCMPVASVPEQEQFPRIQDIGLKKALKNSFYMEFIDRRVSDLFEVCKTCRECPYNLRCGGGCRASAVAEGEKNLMGPDPSRCLMWKGGYMEKLKDVCDLAIEKYCKKS